MRLSICNFVFKRVKVVEDFLMGEVCLCVFYVRNVGDKVVVYFVFWYYLFFVS